MSTKKIEQNPNHHHHQFEGLMFASMAGSAAIVMIMLLFRRALLVSLLDQWRFLAINLLFLAIIVSFTSKKNKMCLGHDECSIDDEYYGEKMGVEEEYGGVEEAVNGGEIDGYGEMSKEELNRRAEAFIARFKKQLVSDHVKSSHARFGSHRVGFVN